MSSATLAMAGTRAHLIARLTLWRALPAARMLAHRVISTAISHWFHCVCAATLTCRTAAATHMAATATAAGAGSCAAAAVATVRAPVPALAFAGLHWNHVGHCVGEGAVGVATHLCSL